MKLSRLKPDNGKELRDNIQATYFTMRGGIVILSLLFGPGILSYSFWAYGTLSESSISAYYGEGNDPNSPRMLCFDCGIDQFRERR